MRARPVNHVAIDGLVIETTPPCPLIKPPPLQVAPKTARHPAVFALRWLVDLWWARSTLKSPTSQCIVLPCIRAFFKRVRPASSQGHRDFSAIYQFQNAYSSKMPLTCTDCPKICCSVIIPPVGVFFEKGCSIHLAINILLTLLGYIPGLIHACFIIVKY